MRQKSICRRLVEEDSSCRTYLLLWIFLVSVVVGLIWQVAELALYGEIQGRAVDDIIGLVYAVTMIMAYYLGRDDEKEVHELSGLPDGRIEFHLDPATLKMLLKVSLIFSGRKIITVTLPCEIAEVQLLRDYANSYLELMEKIEEQKNDEKE